jgi:glycine/D-amino acid oxidase-like deaminating enzyme
MVHNPVLKVTICEALPVPALASTRNAGFACFGSPSELWSDLETMGENEMWRVVEMRYKGIHKILSIVGAEKIGFEPSGGFELFNKDSDWNGSVLRDKLQILNKGFLEIAGKEQVYTDRSSEMAGLGLAGFEAMAGNSIEGGLHSGKLVMALQNLVRQMGVVYLEGHTVIPDSGVHSNYWQVQNSRAKLLLRIKAREVIWATNAWLSQHAGLPRVTPARGQVLLSPPVEGLKLFGTFHYDEGFYYFRNLGNRLLLGGARNKAFEAEGTLIDKTTDEIMQHLEFFIQEKLQQVSPFIGHRGWLNWAGIMGITENKLPFVQKLGDHQWAVLACNGMGVALTPIVAEEIAAEVGRALQ